ncbi:hypothetical protein MC885_015319 [Smutsia gigantea]|nr:hypothetical protein MC885_015319 [Smutsia gigantea]
MGCRGGKWRASSRALPPPVGRCCREWYRWPGTNRQGAPSDILPTPGPPTDVFTIVSRKEWGAAAVGCSAQLTLPVDFLVTHHVPSQTTCSRRLQELQAHHMHNNSWCDVAYNFLVGDDGRAYEGVGWNVRGTHTQGYDNISLGFAFFGTEYMVIPAALLQRVICFLVCTLSPALLLLSW